MKTKTTNVTMKPVQSSNIEAIGYDPTTKSAFVKFSSGTTYEYSEVTAKQFAQLEQAESKGRHFNANWRKFDYRKV